MIRRGDREGAKLSSSAQPPKGGHPLWGARKGVGSRFKSCGAHQPLRLPVGRRAQGQSRLSSRAARAGGLRLLRNLRSTDLLFYCSNR